MVHFYLCIDIHTLWSNRLWANPLNNITINDLNANKPCTVKSKMDIYRGKNYKNYTLFLMSGSDVCLWQGQKRFPRKNAERNPKQKQKEDGDRGKLILAALFTIAAHNYALTFHRDTGPTLAILKMAEQEDVSSQHDEPSHSSTGSQSTSSCREVPWSGLLPTECKAFFDSLGLMHKYAPIWVAPTNFFS